MKKILCIISSLCLLMFPMSAYAQESEQNKATVIEISEFEYLQELQDYSDIELETKGMTQEQINDIREFDLVSTFKDRASLPETTLKNMGYTDDEIVQMKSMLKRRNISEADILKEVRGATLTLTVLPPTCSNTWFIYDYSFKWSSCPFFLYQDLLAITWSATDSTGRSINVAIDKYNSDLTVKYKDSKGFTTDDETYKWDPVHEYRAAKLLFNVGDRVQDYRCWADYGSGSVVFKAVVTGTIYEFYLMFGYGHCIVIATPSVSFLGTGLDVGFDFGVTTQELAKYSRRCLYNGQYQS